MVKPFWFKFGRSQLTYAEMLSLNRNVSLLSPEQMFLIQEYYRNAVKRKRIQRFCKLNWWFLFDNVLTSYGQRQVLCHFWRLPENSRQWQELFCMFLVHMNIILNLKERDIRHLKPIPKEDTLCTWCFCKLGKWQKLSYQSTWDMEGNSTELASSRKC